MVISFLNLKLKILKKYRGVKRVVYTTIDLLQLESSNISDKVFGEFNILSNL